MFPIEFSWSSSTPRSNHIYFQGKKHTVPLKINHVKLIDGRLVIIEIFILLQIEISWMNLINVLSLLKDLIWIPFSKNLYLLHHTMYLLFLSNAQFDIMHSLDYTLPNWDKRIELKSIHSFMESLLWIK